MIETVLGIGLPIIFVLLCIDLMAIVITLVVSVIVTIIGLIKEVFFQKGRL